MDDTEILASSFLRKFETQPALPHSHSFSMRAPDQIVALAVQTPETVSADALRSTLHQAVQGKDLSSISAHVRPNEILPEVISPL